MSATFTVSLSDGARFVNADGTRCGISQTASTYRTATSAQTGRVWAETAPVSTSWTDQADTAASWSTIAVS